MNKYTLRFSILSVFALLFTMSMLGVISYLYYNNTRSIISVSKDLFSHVNTNVINKTISHLRPASQMAELVAANFENHVFQHKCSTDKGIADSETLADTENSILAGRELFFTEIIRSYPQLVAFYIGCEDGYWLSAEKNPDGSVNIINLKVHEDKTVGQRLMINDDNKVIGVETDPSNYLSFDPRIRPWYRGAQDEGKLHWTDTYVYISTKNQLGITASCPVYLKDSRRCHAVIGADIEIQEISRFLQELKIGNSGFAYILNRDHQVIAGPVSPEELLSIPDADAKNRAKGTSSSSARIKNLSEMPHRWLVPHIVSLQGYNDGIINAAHEGVDYIVSYQSFPEWFNPDWKIVIAAPEADFTGELVKTNKNSILVVMLILLLSLLIISKASKVISRPITALTKEADKIRGFDLEGEFLVSSPVKEIYEMNDAFLQLKTALRSFTKYVPETLVKKLVLSKEEAKLGGKKETLTVFFSDIVSFTTISEKLPAEYLALHISEYLDEMTRIIIECGGTIDKYIGDSVMAFWGAPVEDVDHAFHACQAALKCQERLKVLNEKWKKEEKPEFHTRIGIHTGLTIVGNIGSEDRMSYTVMGDTVNTASRLEGLNKQYNTRIIISESTKEAVGERINVNQLEDALLKGKNKKVSVFELVGLEE